jgi:aspartate/methionine/tyrosine aminotransferase
VQVEYVAELIKGAGVAIVPGCGFFHEESTRKPVPQLDYCTSGNNDPDEIYKVRYVRVAFCKDMATLRAAETAFRRHCQ